MSLMACASCLARSWLLQRLAGHLDLARGHIHEVLALADLELIAAVGGQHRTEIEAELARLDVTQLPARAAATGLQTLCRCQEGYPPGLLDLAAPPAALYVAGGSERLTELAGADPVAVVGSRNTLDYGRSVAWALGRGLSVAGVTVVSGLAMGADGAAHAGALKGTGATIAVLAGGAERPYPRANADLYRQIRDRGAVVSELPPGTSARRWMFPARNRIIAALGRLTVVVEAPERSGALLTAALARGLGRPLAAVPGPVTSPLSAGTHRLLRTGAHLVQGPEDVLELLFGEGCARHVPDHRPALEASQRAVFEALAAGAPSGVALARAGLGPEEGLAVLAGLELSGCVRREAGGRYLVLP